VVAWLGDENKEQERSSVVVYGANSAKDVSDPSVRCIVISIFNTTNSVK
jgi:hypothetical protein